MIVRILISEEEEMQNNKHKKNLVYGIIVIVIATSVLTPDIDLFSNKTTPAISIIDVQSTSNTFDNTIVAGDILDIMPLVVTNKTTDVTNVSATLRGYIADSGGEDCSIWFEWDDYDLETECAGLIATGTWVKDGRSIFWKNRHMNANNQKPYFYSGTNYSYYGIGQSEGMCRMGINEKGLAIGNFDIYGSVDPDKRWYLSDEATGSEDGDMHYVLGNFSTVYDAAINLAKHGTFTSQLGIISSEEGVGAIVTLGTDGWTNVTWVNNTWVALGNAIHCNGDSDSKMIRVREKINDIIDNDNSSEGDGLINWRDVTQRFAKDIDSGHGVYSEPYGYMGTYYASGISPSTARSAMIAVCGNKSYDGALNMAWLSFGQTTHLSLFLPLGSSYLESSTDIPSNFTEGNGIETYTDMKQAYTEHSPNRYYRSRVHEIHNYTFHNENLIFDEYDILMDTIMTCADYTEAKDRVKAFADSTMHTALQAYINNLTTYSTNTSKSYPHGSNSEFNETITGLIPGTMYYYKAYANNSLYSSNGSQMTFMTKPDAPTDLSVEIYNTTQINLTWSKGTGAHYTIIERNSYSNWSRGEGTQVYNGTGKSYEDISLSAEAQYNYQLWSFTSAEGECQYSSSYIFAYNITQSPKNKAPIFLGIVPDNESTNVSISTSSLSIVIEDPDGDMFDWTIETSPDVGSSSANGDGNGSKSCSIFDLNYSTTYTWFVNATDGHSWMNKSYWFTTMKTEGNSTIWVDDDYNSSTSGWQVTCFDNIQDGINAVDVLGTVYVYNGKYFENIFVYKTINLIGEDRDNTIIDGSRDGNVVCINAGMVNISNFTIQNSGTSSRYSAIKIFSHHNNILSNNISNNKRGIHLIGSSNNTILDNIISNNKYGMLFWHSNYNTIMGNSISNNKRGIYLSCTYYNNISNNNISNNKYGVYLWHFNSNNLLYHNNLINNSHNAYDKSTNLWDNGYPSGGNYWDDYTGEDQYHGPNQDIIGSDGIGDTPYDIFGKIPPNQDRYPLMYPLSSSC